MSGTAGVQPWDGVRPSCSNRARVLRRTAIAVLGCLGGTSPVLADTWRTSAFASLTGTYTNNVNYSPQDQTTGDFATSLGAGFSVNGEGARVRLSGSVAATWTLYANETQNNSIAPNVNLFGRVEAIEEFLFVEANALVTTSFLTPFGPQPASLVNATDNRYTSQTYRISPYIQGVLGSTNISYLVRDDNIWTVAGSYGNSSNQVPNTYFNTLTATLNSGTSPLGWTAEYVRSYYDNGLAGGNDAGGRNFGGSYTTQIARLIVPYRVDPQFQVSGRIGYEKNEFPRTGDNGVVYGAGLQWSPTERTQMGGFWEHRFYGSSFSWQMSHRLPNAAISASFAKGITSYPELALAIPAGASVAQFVDAALTTRIPDPAARASAVEQFLARTGLPPTLAAPVNFYGTSLTLQNTQSISLVLLGVRNSVSFSVFNVDSTAISGKGEALPPALQFGQDNTQRGIGIGYGYQFSAFTNLAANATYSRTTSDNTAAVNARSNNVNFGVSLNTRFSPKTTGSAGITYSGFRPTGDNSAAGGNNTDSLNVFVGISHTF